MATVDQINNRKRVLRFIETYPELHNQAGYVCKSNACICGTALMFSVFDNNFQKVSGILRRGEGDIDLIVNYVEDDLFWEFEHGRELLGLDEEEAADLFYTWNEAEAVAKLGVLAAEEPDDA